LSWLNLNQGRGRGLVSRPAVRCGPRNSTMTSTTYNTRVEVAAISSVRVTRGPGNRMNDALIVKPAQGRNSVEQTTEKLLFISPKKISTIGTWNVSTLIPTGAVDMLIHELKRLRWDVVGISETHWTGVQEKYVQGYKIITSGSEEGHRSAVGMIVTTRAQQSMLSYNPVSDRITSARFRMAEGTMTICQIYAPTADDEDGAVDSFYNDLQQEINRISKQDKLIVMGDFNVKVGIGDASNRGTVGCYGIADQNERGERLLDFCNANNLSITNTCFKQKRESRNWTWESPDQRTHNKIDYILVSRKLMGSVTNSRSFPSADIGSDHQLVMANIKLKLRTNRPPIRTKKIDIDKLKTDSIRLVYEQKLEEKWLLALTEDTEDIHTEWRKIRDIIKETSEDVLDTKIRMKQKWMVIRRYSWTAEGKKIIQKQTISASYNGKTPQLSVQTSEEEC
jgi:exonuclease III